MIWLLYLFIYGTANSLAPRKCATSYLKQARFSSAGIHTGRAFQMQALLALHLFKMTDIAIYSSCWAMAQTTISGVQIQRCILQQNQAPLIYLIYSISSRSCSSNFHQCFSVLVSVWPKNILFYKMVLFICLLHKDLLLHK